MGSSASATFASATTSTFLLVTGGASNSATTRGFDAEAPRAPLYGLGFSSHVWRAFDFSFLRAFCVSPNSASFARSGVAVFRLIHPRNGAARRQRDVLPSAGFNASSTATHVVPVFRIPTCAESRPNDARTIAPLGARIASDFGDAYETRAAA